MAKINASEKTSNGFTLVEIMVVIALIGILAAIVLASLGSARTQSQVAKATEELKNIEAAFKLYRDTTGRTLPSGDLCTLCEFRSPPQGAYIVSHWDTAVVNDQDFKSVTSANLPVRDPWGMYYVYDNNFLVPVTSLPSLVCSLGPDQILQTWSDTSVAALAIRTAQGDDICVFLKEFDDS